MNTNNIHSSSVISPGATLGERVKIGPFCIVGPKVVLHDNVELKSHVVIDGRTTIGESCILYPFASIGSTPQDLKFKGEDSEVIIGKNNSIREYVTIQPGTQAGKLLTKIGDNCLLMVGTHIAHDCLVGNNVIFANYASLAGHVQVGDYTIIGGLAAVLQFVRIGPHAIIGGVSAVVRDVIPFGLVNSDRGALEGINLYGMKRRGFDKEQSLEASKAVDEIFSEHTLYDDNLLLAEKKYSKNLIVMQIVDFLKNGNTKDICTPKKR